MRSLLLASLLALGACGDEICDFDHLYSFDMVLVGTTGDCSAAPAPTSVTLLQFTLSTEGDGFVLVPGTENWGGALQPSMTLTASSHDDDVCAANMTFQGAWTGAGVTGELFLEFSKDGRQVNGYGEIDWSPGDCLQTFVALGDTDK